MDPNPDTCGFRSVQWWLQWEFSLVLEGIISAFVRHTRATELVAFFLDFNVGEGPNARDLHIYRLCCSSSKFYTSPCEKDWLFGHSLCYWLWKYLHGRFSLHIQIYKLPLCLQYFLNSFAWFFIFVVPSKISTTAPVVIPVVLRLQRWRIPQSIPVTRLRHSPWNRSSETSRNEAVVKGFVSPNMNLVLVSSFPLKVFRLVSRRLDILEGELFVNFHCPLFNASSLTMLEVYVYVRPCNTRNLLV